jgi:TolB-like protein/Flp pilus assembly protein TadD
MVGDIVGYSGLMERAEEETAERLAECQALIADKVTALDGRVFKTTGDGVLAEFPSAVNALRCAFEIRSALAGAQEAQAPFRMRFGLHVADVMVQGDDLVGDGVNLAARIQAAAEPDMIYVSAALFDQVRRNPAFIFDDVGQRSFKNISEPVHLYRLRGEIGAHRLQAMPTQRPAAKERRPASIAVLPFRVAGDDEEQRYLAEGLSEELIVELGRFRRLSVSSRSASFAIAAERTDPVKVGEALGVRFVLEGQMRKIGARVSIVLTLTETEQGTLVWSDKSQSPFEELLAQIDVSAARIAATVSGRMEDAAVVAARRKPPENMTAFDCLLRGLDHHRLGGVTDDNARQSVAWFNKAIEADPNYAAAYAWRVCAGSWLADFDYEQGRRDAMRALELDPCDAEANRIMGSLELMAGNFDAALTHNRRAIELNPTDAYIKARCAATLTFTGQAEQALALLDEARMLDPFLPAWCVEERGIALLALGRREESIALLGSLTFQTHRSRLYRAAALAALGRAEEAERPVREALAAKPGLTVTRFLDSEHYRDSAEAAELGRLLREAGLPG